MSFVAASAAEHSFDLSNSVFEGLLPKASDCNTAAICAVSKHSPVAKAVLLRQCKDNGSCIVQRARKYNECSSHHYLEVHHGDGASRKAASESGAHRGLICAKEKWLPSRWKKERGVIRCWHEEGIKFERRALISCGRCRVCRRADAVPADDVRIPGFGPEAGL